MYRQYQSLTYLKDSKYDNNENVLHTGDEVITVNLKSITISSRIKYTSLINYA